MVVAPEISTSTAAPVERVSVGPSDPDETLSADTNKETEQLESIKPLEKKLSQGEGKTSACVKSNF